MVFLRCGSAVLKRNKIVTFCSLALASALVGACVHPLPPAEIILKSGLDPEGRPIAFSVLPKSATGEVDWVESIRTGLLKPQSSLDPASETPDAVLDLDILFRIGKGYPLPNVVFPHAPHTMWLNCNNCHPVIFSMKQGANPVSMDRIVKGEFCGRCHGKVAFPISNCLRCHSRPKEETPSPPAPR